MIDALSWFVPFRELDLPEAAREAAWLYSKEQGPKSADKPRLRIRTPAEKIEDNYVGRLLEVRAEQIGLTRDSDKYKDFLGEGFIPEWLNGRSEWKTIRQLSLSDAYAAISNSYNKKYDHVIIWACDRSKMLYMPAYVFARGNQRPIARWDLTN